MFICIYIYTYIYIYILIHAFIHTYISINMRLSECFLDCSTKVVRTNKGVMATGLECSVLLTRECSVAVVSLRRVRMYIRHMCMAYVKVCIYIYIYPYIYVYIHICVYTYIYIRTHVHTACVWYMCV